MEWLCVIIDSEKMSVSMTDKKVAEVVRKAGEYGRKDKMTKQELQSVIGTFGHVRKCTRPARLFTKLFTKTITVDASLSATDVYFAYATQICDQQDGMQNMA